MRPLDTAAFFKLFIRHPGVVAETPSGYAAPFIEGIARLAPSGKEFIFASQMISDCQEDIEVGAGISRRRNGRIHFAYAAFRVGVGAFLFAPDARRENQIGQLRRWSGMKPVLNYEKIEISQRMFEDVYVGK